MYQVNFEKLYVDGDLAGKRYHRHQKFETRAGAIFFAKRDGLLIADAQGTYRQESSQIIDLARFA